MGENDMEERRIVALVRDLMFASRIRGVARGAAVAQSPERVLEAMGPGTRLVIVELEAAGSLDLIEAARERVPEARIVAFAPHVLEEALAGARAAGAEALPRGAFVKGLSELVRDAAAG